MIYNWVGACQTFDFLIQKSWYLCNSKHLVTRTSSRILGQSPILTKKGAFTKNGGKKGTSNFNTPYSKYKIHIKFS